MQATSITVEPHPLFCPLGFAVTLPRVLGDIATPSSVTDLFDPEAAAPIARSEAVRKAVRDLLRHGGYKPSGRGKPASEYLVGAASRGRLATINLLVDACNAVSLHSGLPISVVDLDRVDPPLSIGLAEPTASYVFNASGQEIRLGGLLCLGDRHGPCANGVKDAQRSKTHPQTRRALTVMWAPSSLSDHAEAAQRWYRSLLTAAGATLGAITWTPAAAS